MEIGQARNWKDIRYRGDARDESETGSRLKLESEGEIFCVSGEQINALAIVEQSEDGYHSTIGITAPALERLEDAGDGLPSASWE